MTTKGNFLIIPSYWKQTPIIFIIVVKPGAILYT